MKTQTKDSYILSADEIQERFGLDVMTAEVIRHGLINATSQMAWNLTTSAFSSIVRDMQDFAVGISSPWLPEENLQLDLLAAAEGCAIHFFTFQYKARNNILEYGPENLKPGDVLIYNDPFRGGSHVMDVGLAKPIFYNGEIVSFACTDSHWADIGGPVPGGFSPGFAKDMYSEGIRISPRLLYREGERVKETFDLFLDNTRIPEFSLNDLQALAATAGLAEKIVLSLLDKYGKETLMNSMKYILDYGERRMRSAIASFPDGDFSGECYIDDDGVTDETHKIVSKIKIRGSNIELDLSGSSRQAIGNINAQASDVASAGLIGLKSIILPDIETNAGLFRPIDFVLPPGALIHSLPPAANTGGHLVPTTKLVSAIHQSLAEVVPEKVTADALADVPTIALSGWDDRGQTPEPFLCFHIQYGPFGGTATHDGLSHSLNIIGNTMELSYEIDEQFYPVITSFKEFVTDTAGAGKFRGGPAVRWDHLSLVDTNVTVGFDHVRVGTKGVLGGEGGFPTYVGKVEPENWNVIERKENIPINGGWTPTKVMTYQSGMINPETGELDYQSGEFHSGKWANKPFKKGAILVTQTAGGAGYGKPLEREPKLVQLDVINELISYESARNIYGVVLDQISYQIDEKATIELRNKMIKGA